MPPPDGEQPKRHGLPPQALLSENTSTHTVIMLIYTHATHTHADNTTKTMLMCLFVEPKCHDQGLCLSDQIKKRVFTLRTPVMPCVHASIELGICNAGFVLLHFLQTKTAKKSGTVNFF